MEITLSGQNFPQIPTCLFSQSLHIYKNTYVSFNKPEVKYLKHMKIGPKAKRF